MLCVNITLEEATKVNTTQHQVATHPIDIQFHGNMKMCTGTLSVMHATVMGILTINDHINNQNQLILR